FLRVEEFKQKLKDPANKRFSLEGLAFECGFGSKASFQRAFLKNMGITPSEYRKSLQPIC
ncbi:MAG TPA: helix-turn-helix domain-containing protein, partial [Cytophagaceae bacterium]|nr:helix-turn-helix domain-containing protein [Cytophagaceae bacterium]